MFNSKASNILCWFVIYAYIYYIYLFNILYNEIISYFSYVNKDRRLENDQSNNADENENKLHQTLPKLPKRTVNLSQVSEYNIGYLKLIVPKLCNSKCGYS